MSGKRKEADNAGDEWDHKDFDSLLDCIFEVNISSHNWRLRFTEIGALFGRTWKAVHTAFHKLSRGYKRDGKYANYKAKKRISRQKAPFVFSDKMAIDFFESHNPDKVLERDVSHLVQVLQRTEAEIKEHLKQRFAKGRKGFFE